MPEKVDTDLDDLVPASRDDDGVGDVGAEANAGDPLGVAVLLDVVLALAEGVPELDGLIARSRNDLSVVGRESNAKNILFLIIAHKISINQPGESFKRYHKIIENTFL